MNRFLLFFLGVMFACTKTFATEGYKVVFTGEGSIHNWTYLNLDVSLLADAEVGDFIYVEGTQVTENSWTQLQLITANAEWVEQSYAAAASNELTSAAFQIADADMLEMLKTKKFSFKGDNLIINKVAYGQPLNASLVSDASKLPFDTKEWDVDPLQLSGSVFAAAKAGDRVRLTFTTYTTGEREYCQLSISQNYPWTEIYGNAGLNGKTTAEFTLNAENLETLAANGASISGKGVIISAVELVSNSYEYQLYADKNYMDLSRLSGTVDVKLHRTFNWNATLCVPFDVASVTATFGSTAKAYEFKEYSTGLVFIQREHIEAGKPYFMEFGEADKDQTSVSVEGVTVSDVLNNSATSNGLTFKGNYTPGMDMQDKYGIAWNEEWGFFKGGTNTKLNAFSAYFDGAVPVGSRLTIVLENEATGIAAVRSAQQAGAVYNLNGQRVASPVKGLYIKEGKKVMVK